MIKNLCSCHEPYCMKCGVILTDHDESFCTAAKYPALILDDFGYLMKIAELWGVDLTQANEKNADYGRHGAMEGDINLDIIALIQKYFAENEKGNLINYIVPQLEKWDYTFHDFYQAQKKIPKLMRYAE